MNSDKWKPFLLGNVFVIRYGVNLELNKCAIVSNGINFVSRTNKNNGVSARVEEVLGVEPQPAGLITVAGSGSVLSTFLQTEPFYSGRDLFVLDTKEPLSDEVKLFLTTIIEQNKYKYSFGRAANKTLPYIEVFLPCKTDNMGEYIIDTTYEYSKDGYTPNFGYMENYIKTLKYKQITTNNSQCVVGLDANTWKEFNISDLFSIDKGTCTSMGELEDGDTPIISASAVSNGVSGKVYVDGCFEGNKITIGCVSAVAFYQETEFCATSDVSILTPLFEMNKYIGVFISSVFNFSESYKWDFGRKCVKGRIENIKIRLPIQMCDNEPVIDTDYTYSKEGYIPDFKFMEQYIIKLPYGDRI